VHMRMHVFDDDVADLCMPITVHISLSPNLPWLASPNFEAPAMHVYTAKL